MKVSPPEFHFKPTVINKTRTFYEFVLINSNSVSIKYFKDPKDQSLNTHSTIQILKVMQPRHFGPNLNQAKKFSVPFDPGFSPGNAGTTKPKKARISCHFRRMPLSNGGHNLMYPKWNQNRSSFGS